LPLWVRSLVCSCRIPLSFSRLIFFCSLAKELPFISRIVVQSLLAGSPADLSQEGQFLSSLIQPLAEASASPSTSAHQTADPSLASTSSQDNISRMLTEGCPACGLAVPLENITSARCGNGHTWPRCSVTVFILSTSWVRTCIGCSRKAFLPPSMMNKEIGQSLPVVAQGWVVEELLEAVKNCLFCGNGFVVIL